MEEKEQKSIVQKILQGLEEYKAQHPDEEKVLAKKEADDKKATINSSKLPSTLSSQEKRSIQLIGESFSKGLSNNEKKIREGINLKKKLQASISFISAPIKFVPKVVSKIADGFGNFMKKVMLAAIAVGGLYVIFKDWFDSHFPNMISRIKNWIVETFQTVKTWIEKAWKLVSQWFDEASTEIKGFFNGDQSIAQKIGIMLADTLQSLVDGTIGAFIKWIEDFFKSEDEKSDEKTQQDYDKLKKKHEQIMLKSKQDWTAEDIRVIKEYNEENAKRSAAQKLVGNENKSGKTKELYDYVMDVAKRRFPDSSDPLGELLNGSYSDTSSNVGKLIMDKAKELGLEDSIYNESDASMWNWFGSETNEERMQSHAISAVAKMKKQFEQQSSQEEQFNREMEAVSNAKEKQLQDTKNKIEATANSKEFKERMQQFQIGNLLNEHIDNFVKESPFKSFVEKISSSVYQSIKSMIDSFASKANITVQNADKGEITVNSESKTTYTTNQTVNVTNDQKVMINVSTIEIGSLNESFKKLNDMEDRVNHSIIAQNNVLENLTNKLKETAERLKNKKSDQATNQNQILITQQDNQKQVAQMEFLTKNGIQTRVIQHFNLDAFGIDSASV